METNQDWQPAPSVCGTHGLRLDPSGGCIICRRQTDTGNAEVKTAFDWTPFYKPLAGAFVIALIAGMVHFWPRKRSELRLDADGLDEKVFGECVRREEDCQRCGGVRGHPLMDCGCIVRIDPCLGAAKLSLNARPGQVRELFATGPAPARAQLEQSIAGALDELERCRSKFKPNVLIYLRLEIEGQTGAVKHAGVDAIDANASDCLQSGFAMRSYPLASDNYVVGAVLRLNPRAL
jgi:hypothetical protein